MYKTVFSRSNLFFLIKHYHNKKISHLKLYEHPFIWFDSHQFDTMSTDDYGLLMKPWKDKHHQSCSRPRLLNETMDALQTKRAHDLRPAIISLREYDDFNFYHLSRWLSTLFRNQFILYPACQISTIDSFSHVCVTSMSGFCGRRRRKSGKISWKLRKIGRRSFRWLPVVWHAILCSRYQNSLYRITYDALMYCVPCADGVRSR